MKSSLKEDRKGDLETSLNFAIANSKNGLHSLIPGAENQIGMGEMVNDHRRFNSG